MKRLRVESVVKLSARLSIINQDTGSVSPWVLNEEQLEVLRLIIANPRAIVLKGRQIGISTLCLLVVMAFAVGNAGVPSCIVADTRDKAQGLLARLAGWCDQLKIPVLERNKSSITLANGSVIDALSAVSRADAGESRVGRSKSYGLIHTSELAFWMNDEAVFRGLTSTALPGARVIIESTASAADNLFRKLWNDEAGSEWERVFLSLEQHAAYRRDPADIDDETWELLRSEKYGFTRRDTAAWWWLRMRTDFGGDEVGALREFPVLDVHCFANAKGRWINAYTEAATTPDGEWIDGRFTGWMRYKQGAPTEPVVFGVDTAAGHGGDSSALCVLGLHTGTIYATWCSSTTSLPDYIELVKTHADLWKPRALVVEYNGIGIPVYETLAQMTKHNVIKQVSGDEKHLRLQRLKQAIEDGSIPVGPELVYEIKSSRIQPPKTAKSRAEYVGRDDMLNALSFAREYWADISPEAVAVDLVKKLNQEKHVHREFIKPSRKRRTY
jgi:hypothetical protein